MLNNNGLLARDVSLGYFSANRFIGRSHGVWSAWAMACGLLLAWLPLSVFSAEVPQTVMELWSGFAELDKNTPVAAEILKEWEQDGINDDGRRCAHEQSLQQPTASQQPFADQSTLDGAMSCLVAVIRRVS
jgi:hypothetical protein